MCDCQDSGPLSPETVVTTQPDWVTIDILQMYRIPLQCMKTHGSYVMIGETSESVNNALAAIDGMITLKLHNTNSAVDMGVFDSAKAVSFKAINQGICL